MHSLNTWQSLFPVLFFPAFIGLWCGVCYLLSKMSGWRDLAEKYPLTAPFTGETHSWQSGRMGACSYRSCLILGVNHQGLYLSVFPIFAIGAPPLLIPWPAVSGVKREKFFFWKVTKINIGTPPITTLEVYGPFLDLIRRWIAPQLIDDRT